MPRLSQVPVTLPLPRASCERPSPRRPIPPSLTTLSVLCSPRAANWTRHCLSFATRSPTILHSPAHSTISAQPCSRTISHKTLSAPWKRPRLLLQTTLTSSFNSGSPYPLCTRTQKHSPICVAPLNSGLRPRPPLPFTPWPWLCRQAEIPRPLCPCSSLLSPTPPSPTTPRLSMTVWLTFRLATQPALFRCTTAH